MYLLYCFVVFFFKQKTAYEMRISDWSSDVCSSDLCLIFIPISAGCFCDCLVSHREQALLPQGSSAGTSLVIGPCSPLWEQSLLAIAPEQSPTAEHKPLPARLRSEEHTSELQSLMRISYAVFCLKKKNQKQQ